VARLVVLLKAFFVVATFPILHPGRALEVLFSGIFLKKLAGAFVPLTYDPLSIVEPVPFAATPAKPTLVVLLPSLLMEHMTGGPNTAIIIALAVAREGVPVRFLATDRGVAPRADLERHFEQLTGASVAGLSLAYGTAQDRTLSVPIGERDVFLATAWWTAHVAEKGLAALKTKEFIYLIQEYEPLLYPWSVFWQLALDTYSFRFRPMINESFVRRYLEAHRVGNFADPAFAEKGVVFEPCVDEKVFAPRPRPPGRKRRLLFYARAQAPRNLYEWGVLALKRAVAQGAFQAAEWELFFMGDRLDDVSLGAGQVIRQHRWQGYRDYAQMLGEADVGLSLMLSPHTSYPPLEMAASGVQVVTNAFDVKTKAALEALSKNMIAVAPNPDAIVEGLLLAHRRALEARERTDGAFALPRTWAKSLEAVVPRLVETFRALSVER
jgi:hypothetical protein